LLPRSPGHATPFDSPCSSTQRSPARRPRAPTAADTLPQLATTSLPALPQRAASSGRRAPLACQALPTPPASSTGRRATSHELPQLAGCKLHRPALPMPRVAAVPSPRRYHNCPGATRGCLDAAAAGLAPPHCVPRGMPPLPLRVGERWRAA
jgi:hypothetical protein